MSTTRKLISRKPTQKKIRGDPLNKLKYCIIHDRGLDDPPFFDYLAGTVSTMVVSIDIGREHLGVRTSYREIDTDTGFCQVTTIFQRKFTLEPPISQGLSRFYLQTIDLFRSEPSFHQSNIVIVEKQLGIARTELLRDMQHIITYFVCAPSEGPRYVFEVNSKLKSTYLPFRPNLNVKAEAVRVGLEILKLIGDQETIDYVHELQHSKRVNSGGRVVKDKPDDVLDTICQEEALFQLVAIITNDRSFCVLPALE